MAPKRKAGDVPKAVAGLRAKLAERNMEVTSENLRTLQKEMGQGILKAGFTNLSESLTAIGKGSEYKDLRGDAAKREHLARYIMDPDKVLGTSTTTVSVETNDLYQELWLTEEQLEDEPKSKKNAEIKMNKAKNNCTATKTWPRKESMSTRTGGNAPITLPRLSRQLQLRRKHR